MSKYLEKHNVKNSEKGGKFVRRGGTFVNKRRPKNIQTVNAVGAFLFGGIPGLAASHAVNRGKLTREEGSAIIGGALARQAAVSGVSTFAGLTGLPIVGLSALGIGTVVGVGALAGVGVSRALKHRRETARSGAKSSVPQVKKRKKASIPR